jgi:hypothetical protein
METALYSQRRFTEIFINNKVKNKITIIASLFFLLIMNNFSSISILDYKWRKYL